MTKTDAWVASYLFCIMLYSVTKKLRNMKRGQLLNKLLVPVAPEVDSVKSLVDCFDVGTLTSIHPVWVKAGSRATRPLA